MNNAENGCSHWARMRNIFVTLIMKHINVYVC